MYKGIQSSL